MKTILGTEIPTYIRGILYICVYDYSKPSLTVVKEFLFTNPLTALTAYAEIPNPESQLVTGETYEKLCERLERLHKNIQDKNWLRDLGECL